MNRSTSSFHGCEECSFSTNYPFNLRRHVAAVHGNGDAGAEADGGNPASTTPRRKSAPSSEQAPFPCGQCGFETPYKGNLKRHVEKVHKEAEIDEEENRLEDEMEEGNFGNNVVPPPPTEVVLHPAQEVEFVARGGDPAVKQEAKASLPLLAKCQMCAFVAYTVVALREHIMSEHVSLQCAACQFTATREDLLNAHMESVHGARLAPVVIALRGRQLHQVRLVKNKVGLDGPDNAKCHYMHASAWIPFPSTYINHKPSSKLIPSPGPRSSSFSSSTLAKFTHMFLTITILLNLFI